MQTDIDILKEIFTAHGLNLDDFEGGIAPVSIKPPFIYASPHEKRRSYFNALSQDHDIFRSKAHRVIGQRGESPRLTGAFVREEQLSDCFWARVPSFYAGKRKFEIAFPQAVYGREGCYVARVPDSDFVFLSRAILDFDD